MLRDNGYLLKGECQITADTDFELDFDVEIRF